jgi:hypothetical protein
MVYTISNFLSRFDSFKNTSNFRFGIRDLYKVNKFSIYTLYDVHRKKRLGRGLFINTSYFQKKLMILLGKKKYKDFFYFRTNIKHSINYFLQMHYNINITTFSKIYKLLKRKYTLYKVKDFFFFLEYQINIFFKKYLFDVCLEKVFFLKSGISTNNNYVSIGDIIIRKKTSFNFIKFYIFFNFIFFIDPMKLKLKFNLLSIIYKKIYNYFLYDCYCKSSFFLGSNFNNLSIYKSYWIKFLNLILKYKSFFFFDFGKAYIKSLIYYNSFFYNIKNCLSLNYSLSRVNSYQKLKPFKFISIYSLGKSYKQYNLISYKPLFFSYRSRIPNYKKTSSNEFYSFLSNAHNKQFKSRKK